MSRVRIYDLAKELDMPCKELITLLQELGENVSVPANTIDESVADAVRHLVAEERSRGGEVLVSVTEATTQVTEEPRVQQVLLLPDESIPVAEFAKRLEVDVNKVLKKLLDMGIVRPPHQPIDFDLAAKVAEAFGYEVVTSPPEEMPQQQAPAEVEAEVTAAPEEMPVESEVGAVAEAEATTVTEQPTATEEVEEEVAVEVSEEVKVHREEPDMVTSIVTEVATRAAELRRARMEGIIPERMVPRPPIVTVMGHVDHGKTTLLDYIRRTNVAAQEVGQITQHIGASVVEYQGKQIVFIDTPGHEAFTALRARGAQITDIAILVIAADDGVMPQTIEAINHARAAEVPIIVAINKIDKPNANPDRVKAQLAALGLVPVEWGGDTECVHISALTGEGIDELLEIILLQAEIMELKADPKAPAWGVVLEAEMDQWRGAAASVIVQQGTLRRGDHIVAGCTYGRVRSMFDDKGRQVKEVTPSMPVRLYGLAEVPEAGDMVEVVRSAKEAREIAEQRRAVMNELRRQPRKRISLEEIFQRIQRGEQKELRLVVKADVQGSLDAVVFALERLEHPEVNIAIIHQGVGNISESDIMLAAASEAIIMGFNVQLDPSARRALQRDQVDVRLYQVIYELIDDVKRAIIGMLEPIRREEVIGVAEVRATFRAARLGTVAGCYVQSGRIVLGLPCRIVRNGQVVHEGRIISLRRFQEDREEIPEGMECGVGIENFTDFQIGDLIEVYATVEEARHVEEVRERPVHWEALATASASDDLHGR